jgi:hypothetical protein
VKYRVGLNDKLRWRSSGGSPEINFDLGHTSYLLTHHRSQYPISLERDERALNTPQSALHSPLPTAPLPSPPHNPNSPMGSKTVNPLPLFKSWMKADDRLIFLHWVPWPLWAEYDNPERYGLARMYFVVPPRTKAYSGSI